MYAGSKRGIISPFERYSLYLSYNLKAWEALTAAMKLYSYRRGEIIRPGGDTTARITIVKSGLTQVGTVLQEGRGIVTHIMGAGAIWGMPSTYSEELTQPTRTSLSALTDCEVYHIPRHIMLQWIEQNPRHYEDIIHHECKKSLVFVQHIELLSVPTVRCRIATFLLSLSSSIGEDYDDGISIPVRLTHQQIADIVHSDRVTVARILSELVKEGWISKDRGCFVLKQVSQLCNLALGLLSDK